MSKDFCSFGKGTGDGLSTEAVCVSSNTGNLVQIKDIGYFIAEIGDSGGKTGRSREV